MGSVIVFLPNILILYFCISFMEDSGYMARAAFIMDRAMHKIGLHGKSFIPLVMGFGCNVPAIMATRAIESRSSRLITILINPFMSCSVRALVPREIIQRPYYHACHQNHTAHFAEILSSFAPHVVESCFQCRHTVWRKFHDKRCLVLFPYFRQKK